MPSENPASGWPRPTRPRLSARVAYAVHALVAPRPPYRWLATRLERHPRLNRWFTAGERFTKEELFGCQMCGQCALPATGYACPMTCPKQLRNGPCGGVSPAGQCEVHPEMRCVWVIAYERAAKTGHGTDLDLLQRPVDRREFGRSSWVNYWQGRDDGLWVAATAADPAPLLPRDPAEATK
ncbi:MAG: methylenetetrahydrofolate reductase C-terminal domain-containing protein [Actinobacteria bacterium]|nr:methylenetetrahydrofolate reductase C-terminal domain-containing protein [Actinomycetota bacterium]MBO0835416.1 methylenetetrahydrofolate reductase C-terminal domain-containing protein [Actinomycetota bacterium]